MPYISSYKKELLDTLIPKIKSLLIDKDKIDYGGLEYLIFKVLIELTNTNKRFEVMNSLIGILHTTASEYTSKVLAPYENDKLLNNWIETIPSDIPTIDE